LAGQARASWFSMRILMRNWPFRASARQAQIPLNIY
jgi:hypothetical protein